MSSLRLELLVWLLLWPSSSWLSSSSPWVGAAAYSEDFQDLNRLLEGVVVRLPDATVSTSAITVRMTEVRCTDLRIGDANVGARQAANGGQGQGSKRIIRADLAGLDMVCVLEYVYTFLFTRRGTAYLQSYGNSASLSVEAETAREGQRTTTKLAVASCQPDVQVSDLDFVGGISALVLSAVEGSVRNQVELEANTRLCEALQSSLTGNGVVAALAKRMDATLARYPPGVSFDPLRSEKVLRSNNSTALNLLDFQGNGRQSETRAAAATYWWFHRMLDEATAFATKQMPAAGVDTTRPTDMNANALLRQYVLDDDGMLVVPDVSQIIFVGHDRLTRTQIVLDQVKVLGLDTITSLGESPGQMLIGRHTMQNQVSWKYLGVELHMTLDIKPSTLENSYTETRNGDSAISESIKVSFGLEGIEAAVSVLLGIDEGRLGALQLANLLDTNAILGCLLSTIGHGEISGLAVALNDVVIPPTLEGFVSPGLDRLASQSVDAMFQVYESDLLRATPGFFQTTAKQRFNAMLRNFDFAKAGSARGCPTSTVVNTTDDNRTNSGYIDFRDLLLPPELALMKGGSGTQPYGDVVSTVMSQIKEQLFAIDSDGSPKINTFIRNALSSSSKFVSNATMTNLNNTEVYVAGGGDVLSTTSSLGLAGLQADFTAKVHDVRIENFDSFGGNLQFLEPVDFNAHSLNTSASIGVGGKDVRLEAKLLLDVADEKGGLQLRNEVLISLELRRASLVLLLVVEILERQFFSVQLKDTLDPSCWLYTMYLPSASGTDSTDAATGLLSMTQNSSFTVEQLAVNISCLNCTSPDFDRLMYRLYSPDTLLDLWDALLKSDYLQNLTNGILGAASKQCPQSSAYDPGFTFRDLFMPGEQGWVIATPERDRAAHYFNVSIAAVSIVLIVSSALLMLFVSFRYQKWKETLSHGSLDRLREIEKFEQKEQLQVNERAHSLFHSVPCLPRRTRLGFPLVLVITLALQLAGHLGVLSAVDLWGQIAGQPFFIGDFLQFTFVDAAVAAYGNGGPEMAVLVLIFTGIWPYLKLLAMFTLWFAPPSKVSVTRRHSVAHWLDVLAKLSIVDIFLVLLIVATILVFSGGGINRDGVPSSEQDGEVFFSLKFIIKPGAAFFCILIAQQMLRASSRYLLDCHNRAVASGLTNASAAAEGNALASKRQKSFRRVSSRTTARMMSSSDSWRDLDDDDEHVLANATRTTEFLEDDASNDDEEEEEEEDRATGRRICSNFRWKRHAAVAKSESRGEEEESYKTRCSRRTVSLLLAPSSLAVALATLLVVTVLACVISFAPSVALDTRRVWGMVSSSRTFADAVDERTVFGIVTGVLIEARPVLDDARDYVGAGLMVLALAVVAAAPPALSFYSRRQQRRNNSRTGIGSSYDGGGFCGRRCPFAVQLPAYFRRRPEESDFARSGGENDDDSLVPLFRAYYGLKAWRSTQVYVVAFVVACWQLGAVAAYSVHFYCFLLESLYGTLAYLGLAEQTGAQCFRAQASSPSTVAIVFLAYLVLTVSFLVQAAAQYLKVLAGATTAGARAMDAAAAASCSEGDDRSAEEGNTTREETTFYREDDELVFRPLEETLEEYDVVDDDSVASPASRGRLLLPVVVD